MLNLGILAKDGETENETENELLNLSQIDNYKKIFLDSKEQLHQLDGLIIRLSKKESLGKLIDWLIECKKYPELFIWVYSEEQLDYEEELLLKFGINGIVMQKRNLSLLHYLVNNTFSKIMKLLEQETSLMDLKIIDEKNQLIYVNGSEVELTRTEFKLVCKLYDNKNNVVSYDELINFIWPKGIKDGTIRLANIITHLREKIKNSDKFDIKTIRSVGYVFKMK